MVSLFLIQRETPVSCWPPSVRIHSDGFLSLANWTQLLDSENTVTGCRNEKWTYIKPLNWMKVMFHWDAFVAWVCILPWVWRRIKTWVAGWVGMVWTCVPRSVCCGSSRRCDKAATALWRWTTNPGGYKAKTEHFCYVLQNARVAVFKEPNRNGAIAPPTGLFSHYNENFSSTVNHFPSQQLHLLQGKSSYLAKVIP